MGPPSTDTTVINVTTDGLVRKTVLTEGTGEEAGRGAKVTVKYSLHLCDGDADGALIDTSDGRPTGTLTFTQGRRKVIAALDVLTQSMTLGEKCRAVADAAYAFGSKGLKRKNVPPNSDVVLHVEMMAFEGGEKKKLLADMTPRERFDQAKVCKEDGNSLFKELKYEKAMVQYSQCIRLVSNVFYKQNGRAPANATTGSDNGTVETGDSDENGFTEAAVVEETETETDMLVDEVVSATTEPITETAVQPTTEPSSETAVETTVETTVEPTMEPAMEPTSKTTSGLTNEAATEMTTAATVEAATEETVEIGTAAAVTTVEATAEIGTAAAVTAVEATTSASNSTETEETEGEEVIETLDVSTATVAGDTLEKEAEPKNHASMNGLLDGVKEGKPIGTKEDEEEEAEQDDDPEEKEVKTLHVTALNNLSLCLVKMEQFKQAVDSATLALQMDPESSKAFYYRYVEHCEWLRMSCGAISRLCHNNETILI